MRTLFTLLFGFLLFSGTAQNSIIDALVVDFERGKTLSLAYIEAMPEDKFDFSPDDEAQSFALQMLHMAQGTVGLSANGTGAESPFGQTNLAEDTANHTKTRITEITTEAFDFVISSVKAMDPATFDEVVERGPFKVTRLGWVNKAKEHLNHHRGQTAVYLRLNGVKPPQYNLF
ncbi:MAG: damage-inducible protein DinB [Bacteroidia bacterium]|nr:damage-inducible protein DinB [Bacteroidia bacterium]MBT8253258.1 damage-inducible protein DinB [Bacteroidia bacterium]